MKIVALIAALALFLPACPAMAKSTKGYTTRNGSYVQPYQSTNPNSTKYDNYDYKGNVNPYTGKRGTRD